MKKLIFTVILSGLFMSHSYAQGWIGDATGTSLNAVNSSLGTNPINVGIGVTIPTARLHTNGNLRFQGLSQTSNLPTFNRVLLTDAAGNVEWSDFNNLNTDDADWFVTGTTNTPGAIGDNIYTTGNVSINTQNQTGQLTVVGSPNRLALAITQGQAGVGGGIFMNGGGSINSGRIFMDGNFLQIGRQNNNDATAQDAIRIDANGQVGINLPRPAVGTLPAPTADLHVDGTVRLENLASGNGNILVADANGNVFLSNCTCPSQSADLHQTDDYRKLEEKLSKMEAEMALLRTYLKGWKGFGQEEDKVGLEKNALEQNRPNPFTGSTAITYNLAQAGHVDINVFNSRGEHISNLLSREQNKGEHTIDWDANGLPTGMYFYTLTVNGTEISKKAILGTN